MKVYYNEFDAYPAQWLRNLQGKKLIPPGVVDERSIADVRSRDLEGVDQAHFFAGIGGWPLALRLAGWPDSEEVWTGSCPCQPFSAAGKRKGEADERHLWPQFFRLIRERRPAVVFGEQVASKDGRRWLSGVRADLEGLGYAVGAADLCAAGVAAPHIRQRLWWVAHAHGWKPGNGDVQPGREHGQQPANSAVADRVADPMLTRRPERRPESGKGSVAGGGVTGGLAQPQGTRRLGGPGAPGENRPPARDGRGVGDAHGAGLPPRGQAAQADRQGRPPVADGGAGRVGNVLGAGLEKRQGKEERQGAVRVQGTAAVAAGPWSAFDIVWCQDGLGRRVEAGTFPLAHGVPDRVGKLRAYGNAIVPQVAAEFIKAFREAVRR